MSDDLAGGVVAFAAWLRGEHGYGVVPGQTHDAMRALEAIGIEDRARVRAALRVVLCGERDEALGFDGLFDDFFSSATAGVAQPEHARRTRPDSNASPDSRQEAAERRRPQSDEPDEAGGFAGQETAFVPHEESLAEAWMAMQARYSPAHGAEADTAMIPTEGLERAHREANRLVTTLRLGRSRTWKPLRHGRRFDLRRTLRESLRNGGDAMLLHRLGHPLRSPRFVLLLDASRSMATHAGEMLQFAHALCRRSRRAAAFLFSTELREVTRDLRDAGRDGAYRLRELGEAWGGGTRIGASLREFVRRYGSRLSDQTLVVIFSDGLDVGDIGDLKWAMNDLQRRSAAVAWINPHVGEPGYTPSARGMQAALPYVDVFAGMGETSTLAHLERRGSAA